MRKQFSMVTERTISLQLKELEKDGLIKRTVYNNKPPLKVDYKLTEFGQTLVPLLKDLAHWGGRNAKEKQQ